MKRLAENSLIAALMLFIQGCTHFTISDCGGEVLGVDEPRIRSSHFRMLLADVPAASYQFLPYSAMSSLSYVEKPGCEGTDVKVNLNDREELIKVLDDRGWVEDTSVEWVSDCETTEGLFFSVWVRDADEREVVIAFRGTWGSKDWLYGNLHWITRFLPMSDQYKSARQLVSKVFAKYDAKSDIPTTYKTTGHSLGGGLAQNILYSYPEAIKQAIVFNPSSATGFSDQSDENKLAACKCDSSTSNSEARILRVYTSYEILANLRIFHKIFLPPERHIQEIRFPNNATHSMISLSKYFITESKKNKADGTVWFAGKGSYSESMSCTDAFIKKQTSSCVNEVSPGGWTMCPQ